MRKVLLVVFLLISVALPEATVMIDPYGVPHIFAKRMDEALGALGFQMAKDRMFMMDALRRISTASVSSLIGPLGVAFDRQFLAYGFREKAEEMLQNLSAHSRVLLEAFVGGINRAIEKGAYSRYFYEQLKLKPSPFKPSDVLAISLFTSFQLLNTVEQELLSYNLMPILGKEGLEQLMGVPFPKAEPKEPLDVGASFFPPYFSSNNWAVAGEKTKSGNAMLAGDPHVLLSQPPLFYEAHIKTKREEVYGVTVPGVPLFIIGFTPKLAFSATVSWADVVDLLVFPYDAKKDRFFDGSDWVPLEKKAVYLEPRGSRKKKIVVYRTPQGNVIQKGKSELLVFKYAPFYIKSDVVHAAMEILKAKSVEEARLIFARLPYPSLNMALADTNGDVALQLTGLIPVRKGKFPYFPSPPNSIQWAGFIPVEEKPFVLKPKEGFVASANNNWFATYKSYITFFTAPGFRASRIKESLSSRDQWTLEEVFSLQDDTYSKLADAVLGETLPLLLSLPEAKEFARTLSSWDRKCDIESVGCALFHVFLQALLKNIFKDELGRQYQAFLKQNYIALRAILRQLEDPSASSFIDDKTTKKVESFREVLLRVLDETKRVLKQYNGLRTTWGSLHRVSFDSLFAPLGVKSKSVDEPIKGGLVTVFRSDYSLEKPFQAVLGAPFRFAVEMGKRPKAIAILGPGNQEDPKASHAYDQLKLWLKGKPRRILLDKKVIKASAEKIYKLRDK